ncbi:MAG: TMEM175 family protein, partial [Pyrinomonadaceae bacterium]
MDEAQKEPKAPSTGRIEQFSDGVFAIVITLLVLTLQVPKIENEKSVFDVLNALFQLLPKFLGFVMSFFFVAVFWVAHHQFFHTLNLSTRTLLWLNNLFLFFITFIPFPTALLGEYPDNIASVIFFG